MADEENKDTQYNLREEAMNYGTIQTSSLFEKGKSAFKLTLAGGSFTVRIPWSSIIWGGIFCVVSIIISVLLFAFVFFKSGIMVPILAVVVVACTFAGAKIGVWSPLASTTGEDLNTYLVMLMRQKLSMGGFGQKKVSSATYDSYALGSEALPTKCTLWLGTQPLRDAPPTEMTEERGMIIDEETNERKKETIVSDMFLTPRGEYQKIPDDNGYLDEVQKQKEL